MDATRDRPRHVEVVATSYRGNMPAGRRKMYLVVWWMDKAPFAATFDNEVAAKAAAHVRNAILVTVSGSAIAVDAVEDWYRRNENGDPMPAEWRELTGQPSVAWPGARTLGPPRTR